MRWLGVIFLFAALGSVLASTVNNHGTLQNHKPSDNLVPSFDGSETLFGRNLYFQ